MARRTKEDAQLTRHSLLDAAELLFHAQGVSRTSLNDIAHQAGTSRGAIYWHFKDKADLFNAMMERVTLPLEQAFHDMVQQSPSAPLAHVRAVILTALGHIATDARTRRVFEVATHKVEYVDELQAVQLRHLQVCNDFQSQLELGLIRAAAAQQLSLPISSPQAAQGLHALVDGMIQNWLLNTQGFDLRASGELVIDVYLKGLGFRLEPQEDS